MSLFKCIKIAYIQDLDMPEIIKCDAEHMYVFISDMHRLKTMLALVVVIVVRYHSFLRSSLLTTNQDFHTQMWQEKSDLGTMNKNGFNSGPVLNVSRVSIKEQSKSKRRANEEQTKEQKKSKRRANEEPTKSKRRANEEQTKEQTKSKREHKEQAKSKRRANEE